MVEVKTLASNTVFGENKNSFLSLVFLILFHEIYFSQQKSRFRKIWIVLRTTWNLARIMYNTTGLFISILLF